MTDTDRQILQPTNSIDKALNLYLKQNVVQLNGAEKTSETALALCRTRPPSSLSARQEAANYGRRKAISYAISACKLA